MTTPSAAAAISSASVVAVACSGGADSAAALLETRRLAPAADIVACYVDHGVRPRASIDRDIAAVVAQANAVGACTQVARLHWPAKSGHASEAVLRKARYAALTRMAKRMGASLIVTGHHAGDVAEWVLISLLRGSGMDGVTAMRETRRVARGVVLARPLLGTSKSALAASVLRLDLPVSADETNAETRYTRNFVRSLLAAYSERGNAPEKTLARSAMLLADDREALDALVRAELLRAQSAAAGGGLDTRTLRAMSPAVLRRVIRMMVGDTAGASRDFSLAHCDAIARAVREKRGGEFHAGNASVLLSGGLLRVVRSPGHVRTAGELRSPYYRMEKRDAITVRLRAAAIPASPNFTVRVSEQGDICVPSGRKHPISLARFLAKEGVPRDLRGAVPLLCVNGQLAAAIGVRVMEPFAPAPGDATVDVTWKPGALPGQVDSTDSINMKFSSP